METNGIEWFWFDLDDTLYDFSRSSLVALNEVYARHGLARLFPDRQEWIDCYHHHNKILWDLYNDGSIGQEQLRRDRFVIPLTQGGMDDGEAEALWPVLDSDYLDMLGRSGLLIDSAYETIATLRKRGHHIGILSNGFTQVQHQKLASCNLLHMVDCIVLSDEIGINKPDRRLYDHAITKSGATPGSSLMIGDNPDTDIAGALNAGWRAVLFDPMSLTTVASPQMGSVKVIKSLRELLKW